VTEIVEGVRSLLVAVDSARVALTSLAEQLAFLAAGLADPETVVLPAREVVLPIAFDHPEAHEAMRRYATSVRPDAPWCPDNVEFIRRVNDLGARDDVFEIVQAATYLVVGLGDVYLGAPVAVPVDPRHRLVTTKYNPARTWTPQNAVGIGGIYLCVYGMEGPGGYQLVGRTVQMWNRYQQTADFRDGKQWLLRFFDQIRFYPVSSEELLKLRAGFPYGRHPLRIEESHLDLGDYLKFLESQRESIDEFRQSQRSAFDAERERWRTAGLAETAIVENAVRAEAPALPEDCVAITSPVSGSVWQIKVAAGQNVEKGDTLVIMEAMKMEIAVLADTAGTVHSIHGIPGVAANAGDTLLVFKPVLS